MRLTCPSCRAQYEVDDDAIPADGRDVQCGACNTTWFQGHALTLTGAIPAAVAGSTRPVFKHHGSAPGTAIPAPQPMPDDSPADRDKLLREIREEAEQQISFEAKSRIEREPLPGLEVEAEAAHLAFDNEGGAPDSNVEPNGDLPRETKLNTSDVHEYQADLAPLEPMMPAPEREPVEEAFMQNLRSQIEEQNSQPDNFATARSSSVMSAAEKAGISLDPAKVSPPSDSSRTTSLQNTLRELGSTPEPEPRRRSYSVGVYTAAVLFLLAFATYLLRGEITKFYPAAGPALEAYAAGVDSIRLVVQDLWTYARNWVTSLIG